MGKGSFSGNPKTEWLCEHGDDRNMCLLETLLATDLQSTGDNVEAIRATVARHLGPARP
jgi:hypothetical protein